MEIDDIKKSLTNCGWFQTPGIYAMSDGQYGSTGKGLIAGAMGEMFGDQCDVSMCNAGPNAGHTSYFDGEHIMLKQLPTFGVTAHKMAMLDGPGPSGTVKNIPVCYLNAGSIIDPNILDKEVRKHNVRAIVHPHAAVIDSQMKAKDEDTTTRIASTGQGVGPAFARKINRVPEGVVWSHGLLEHLLRFNRFLLGKRVFAEVSQGFSLGINQGFYPTVTSRACTVGQIMADAGVAPTTFRKSLLSVRTFPIRVGNTENSSGAHYPDQNETSWEALGQQPELTTVTGRVRRVFTWSTQQFMDAVIANDPSVIFLNFCNYLYNGDVDEFVQSQVLEPYRHVTGTKPEAILLGYGPLTKDIVMWRG